MPTDINRRIIIDRNSGKLHEGIHKRRPAASNAPKQHALLITRFSVIPGDSTCPPPDCTRVLHTGTFEKRETLERFGELPSDYSERSLSTHKPIVFQGSTLVP